MGVGLRLKMVLREKKMTIKELSARSGISLNTLYSITKRDTENVDTVILREIADTLGLSWSFFSGVAPFEDLDFLNRNKNAIIEEMQKMHLLPEKYEKPQEIDTYKFWELISNYVFDVILDQNTGRIQVLCDYFSPSVQCDTVDTAQESLLKIFNSLDFSGKQLVIEYAELLASNPSFLRKQ